MTTDEDPIAVARTRVGRFLRASFDDVATDDEGNFQIRHRGVLTRVAVVPWKARIGVVALAESNASMRVDDDLTLLLATEGKRLPFGQFELRGGGLDTKLWIAHDMLEPHLTRLELETVVDSIGRASTRYGAAIHEWRGGRRPDALDAGPAASEVDDQLDEPDDEGDDAPAAGAHERVRALRFKIEACLEELDTPFAVDGEGDVLIERPTRDALVWLRPVPWSRGRTLVQVWAVTNEGMTVDGELTRYLVDTNAGLGFGGFRLDLHGPQTIVGSSLLGETLSSGALGNVVECVSETAEEHGPEIVDRFGGRLFSAP